MGIGYISQQMLLNVSICTNVSVRWVLVLSALILSCVMTLHQVVPCRRGWLLIAIQKVGKYLGKTLFGDKLFRNLRIAALTPTHAQVSEYRNIQKSYILYSFLFCLLVCFLRGKGLGNNDHHGAGVWALNDQQKLLRTQGFASGLQPGGSLTAATAGPGSRENVKKIITAGAPHLAPHNAPRAGPRGAPAARGSTPALSQACTAAARRAGWLGGPAGPGWGRGRGWGQGRAAGRPDAGSREPLPWRRQQSRAAALRAILSIKQAFYKELFLKIF